MGEPVKSKNKSGKPSLMAISLVSILATGALLIYSTQLKQQPTQQLQTQELSTDAPTQTIESISALGRIEPVSEVIKVAPTPTIGGSKVTELRVDLGELVEPGEVIAILDNHEQQKAAVTKAQKEVKVAEANLAIIEAGPKIGEINAQKATIERLQAELAGEKISNQATITRLEAQLEGEIIAQKATIERLKAELENAQTEFARYEKLAKDGAISASDLDKRSLTLQTATEQVKEAEANLIKTIDTLEQEILGAKAIASQTEQTLNKQIIEAQANLDRIKEVRDVDVEKAQAELEMAQANLEQVQEDLELTYVKSPIKGRVLKINTYPGENVDEENGVVELGQTEPMMAIAEVYESDIKGVKVGQKALIESETGSFNGQLKGTVTEIGWQISKNDVLDTDPAADVDSRIIEVKIKLNPEDSEKVQQLTYSKVLVKINLS